MGYHKNAPWTAVSRERLARMVIEDGMRLGSAAGSVMNDPSSGINVITIM